MDFLYQFNLGLIAPLFTGSFHEMFEIFFFFLNFQKLAGLWLVGEVDNHVAIYGSKVAEGFSAFQRRSCYIEVLILNLLHLDKMADILCIFSNAFSKGRVMCFDLNITEMYSLWSKVKTSQHRCR